MKGKQDRQKKDREIVRKKDIQIERKIYRQRQKDRIIKRKKIERNRRIDREKKYIDFIKVSTEQL